MELLCPSCQQKLTIPDQYAGQLMRCPLCNGTFTAPALAPVPPAAPQLPASSPPPSPPTPAAPGSYAVAPPEPPPPPPWQPEPPPTLPDTPAPPPLPPGDYTRSFSIVLSAQIVPWIAPAALGLVFVLSFFPWVSARALGVSFSLNAWNWGFGEHPSAIIGIYLLFTLVALVLAVPSCLFALNLAPMPPAVQKLGPWRPAIVAAAAALAFVFLFYSYLDEIFRAWTTPGTIWLKLAFRSHIVAIAGALLEFWLEVRKGTNLPPPKFEVRW
jgi:hypothetical protein